MVPSSLSVTALLPKEEIQRLGREELETLAAELGIDVVGRTVDELQSRCYEVANGLPPEPTYEAVTEDAYRGSTSIETPDTPPDLDVTEDEARRRMFELVSEFLAPDVNTMSERDARALLSWCPVLPSGEPADCYACPLRSLRSCYTRHRAFVE